MKHKIEDSQCPNLAILNENIAVIELIIEQNKSKTQTFFSERKKQLDQKKENDLQQNKAKYDDAIEAAKNLFANTPKLTWSAHQAAETMQKDTCTTALKEYDKKEQTIQTSYAGNVLLLESDTIEYQREISEIDKRYAIQLAMLNDASLEALDHLREPTTDYYRRLDEALKTYERTIAKAQQFKSQKCLEAFNLYDKAYKTANGEHDKLFFNAQMESLGLIAQAVGLDGVSSDVNSFVISSDNPFDVIQPLLTYTDLRHALMMAAKPHADTRIIEIFYDTFGEKTLEDTVRSFDLAGNLQSYVHVCSFTSPVPPLNPKTLYVEFSSDEVICTVLCPYGSIITKSFDANSTFHLASIEKSKQLDWMKSCLEKNVSRFVLPLYYGNKASQYDAFSHELVSVPGLKEHMLHTIYTYNKEMIKAQGWGSAKLTKKHLYYSGRDNYSVVDKTPIELIREIRDIAFAEAQRCYEISKKQFEEDYQVVATEALRVKNETCAVAAIAYEEKCSYIDKGVYDLLYCLGTLPTLSSSDMPISLYNENHSMFFSGQKPTDIDEDDLKLDEEIAGITKGIEYSNFF